MQQDNPLAAVTFRLAQTTDVEQLLALEHACFATDRLSRRSFHRWLTARHGILLVAERNTEILAYGLVWCHKGTRLARLYSMAVSPKVRGIGLAKTIMVQLEAAAAERGRLYMRLEVAKQNEAAIALYRQGGYRIFGEYYDYYDDHSDALRMQKLIHPYKQAQEQRLVPWFQQTTEFTCGPAALMMAMNSFTPEIGLSRPLELDIWREATTIFMTSGHGGCHPLGLALAASKRGFNARVFINTEQVLFVDGVRSNHKKEVMELVHQQFVSRARAANISIDYSEINFAQLSELLQQGYVPILLISTYRLDGKKSPHWVTVTGADEDCLYVHDPDLDGVSQLSIDCQYVPIAREQLNKISRFGAKGLRTLVAINMSA